MRDMIILYSPKVDFSPYYPHFWAPMSLISIAAPLISLGFKVVVDTDKNPVYPGNQYHYYSESSKRNDVWKDDDGSMKLKSGNTYHFRVCIYKGGSCGAYSNDVSVSF